MNYGAPFSSTREPHRGFHVREWEGYPDALFALPSRRRPWPLLVGRKVNDPGQIHRYSHIILDEVEQAEIRHGRFF